MPDHRQAGQVQPGSAVRPDEAAGWDALHAWFETRRTDDGLLGRAADAGPGGGDGKVASTDVVEIRRL